MSIADYVIVGILLLCVVLAVRYIVKQKRSGGCIGCSGCGCAGCEKAKAKNTTEK